MKNALSKLEKGAFAAALDDINDAMRSLGTIGGESWASIYPTDRPEVSLPDVDHRKREARLCVGYRLALKLLIEIKLLEKDAANKVKIAGTSLIECRLDRGFGSHARPARSVYQVPDRHLHPA